MNALSASQNTFEMTAATIARELGESEIPDMFVVVAKHEINGFDSESIADILGCEMGDLLELLADPLYKRVKDRLSEVHAAQLVNQTTGWDALESMALAGLAKRLPFVNDHEYLLKVAAVANRATRKVQPHNSGILDPGLRAGRTTITLTQRLVSKINAKGDQVQEETRQLSIRDGSMSNPSFAEIDSLLTVSNTPLLPTAMSIRTHEPTADELLDDFMRE